MNDDEVTIHWTRGPDELEGAIGVRHRVFCVEQGVPSEDEIDGRDGEALHLVAVLTSKPLVIGTLRLFSEGERAKIGRVAVERDWRRRGVASRLLATALERARELGCTSARLAAQLDARGVYEHAGFVTESDVFEEAGIEHVWMGRSLLEGRPSAAGAASVARDASAR